MATAEGAQQLPAGCTADTLKHEGPSIDVYCSELPNPSGGDLPGAETAKVCWVVLNRKDRSVNVVDQVFAEDLERALELCPGNDVTVFLSAKEAGFGAGADVESMYHNTDSAKIEAAMRRVLKLYQRIARGVCGGAAVAWLHGNTLGGVFELALHCQMRVAAQSSKVGLPEVKLGMLPGLGGAMLVPHLAGLQDGLRLILKGSVVPVGDALRLKLVDRELERFGVKAGQRFERYLWEVYRRSAAVAPDRTAGKNGVFDRSGWAEGSYVGRRIVAASAYSSVQAAVGQTLPAPYAALNATLRCFYARSHQECTDIMAAATAAVSVCSPTKALMRGWLANRDLRHAAKRAREEAAPHASPPEDDEAHGRAPVFIGSAEEVATALGTVVNGRLYVKLCTLTSRDRLRVADVIEEKYASRWSEDLSHFMQHCSSLETEQRPVPEGYGAIGIVWSDDQAAAAKAHFLDYLPEEDGWLYVDLSGAAGVHSRRPLVRVDVARTKLASTADVLLDPATRGSHAACCRLLQVLGFALLTSPAHPEGTVTARAALSVVSAVLDVADSVEPNSAPQLLGLAEECCGLPEGSLPALLSSGVVQRAAERCGGCLADFCREVSASGPEPALRRRCIGGGPPDATLQRDFLAAACRHAAALVREDLPPYIVDYLYVLTLGWPAHVGGPFATLDQRFALGELPAQCVSGCALLQRLRDEKAPRVLADHPGVSAKADAVAWEYAAKPCSGARHAYRAKVGMRDILLPLVLWAAYTVITSLYSLIHWRFTHATPQRQRAYRLD